MRKFSRYFDAKAIMGWQVGRVADHSRKTPCWDFIPNPKNSKPPGLVVGRFFGGAGFVVHSIFPFYEQIFSFFMIYSRSCDIVNSFDEIFLLAEISLYDLSSQLFAITTGAVYAAMIAPKNLIFAS